MEKQLAKSNNPANRPTGVSKGQTSWSRFQPAPTWARMMQRILAGFSALPGADQAYVISRRQGLIASVGKKGKMPEIESSTKLV